LDYKTTQHHLKALALNGLVSFEEPTYGVLYFLTPDMEEAISVLDEIMAKLGHMQIKRSYPESR